MTTIRVFHNNNFRDATLLGYQPKPYTVGDEHGEREQPAHTVTEVYRFELRDSDRPAADDPHPAKLAYDLFNIGDDPDFWDPPDGRAIDYRDRANRSLSVGDVIAVDNNEGGTRWYACAPIGWDTLNTPPVIDNQEDHGTTPHDAPLITYTVRFESPDNLAVEPWRVDAYARSQLARRIREKLTGQLNTEKAVVVLTPDDDTGGGYTGIARTRNSLVDLAAFTAHPDQQDEQTR